MKRIAHSVLLAGLAALALGACTTGGMRGDTTRTSSVTDGEYGSTPDVSSGAGTAMGSSASSATASGAATYQAGQSDTMASTPNSTVTNIEIVPRQSGAGTGAGTVAGAAVGGATGSSMTSDRVYRVTLRMDDGTPQTVTQESTPGFRVGDRVRLSEGAIVR